MKRNLILLTIFTLLITILIPNIAFVQPPTWPDCGQGCSANDQEIELWIGGIDGNDIPEECSSGDKVTAYVWVKIKNPLGSGATRYGYALVGYYTINGVETSLDVCFLDSLGGGEEYGPTSIYNFSWECGDEVEICPIIAYSTKSDAACNDCGNYQKPKCKKFDCITITIKSPECPTCTIEIAPPKMKPTAKPTTPFFLMKSINPGILFYFGLITRYLDL